MDNAEERFVDSCIAVFEKYFVCQREVWSKCGNGRIDILLSLPSGEHFGIEAKQPNSKRGEEIARYVKQAIRYTEYEFLVEPNIYKRVPIFICPPISYKYFLLNNETKIIDGSKWHKDRHHETFEHHSFNGFLGGLGIGEVRSVSGKDFILSFSNKIIFDTRLRWNYQNGVCMGKELKGLHQVNYDNLIKKSTL